DILGEILDRIRTMEREMGSSRDGRELSDSEELAIVDAVDSILPYGAKPDKILVQPRVVTLIYGGDLPAGAHAGFRGLQRTLYATGVRQIRVKYEADGRTREIKVAVRP